MPTKVPFGLSLSQQIEKMAKWREPIVLSTAACVVLRHNSSLLDNEVLITKRIKGAKAGNHQLYIGGYAHPNDTDLSETASRELDEELGIPVSPSQFQPIGVFGPSLYLSSLLLTDNRLTLTISENRAEPNASFTLSLFCLPHPVGVFNPKDGEIEIVGWKSLRQTVLDYGQKSEAFNYAHILFALVQHLRSPSDGRFPHEPGNYELTL